jgi:phage shock protein A
MTLIARMTRLFKADLHGILDSLEEPEEVVKQAIRDMEEDIATQERWLDELHAVLQRLAREAQELTVSMQESEQQIDLCFTAGNEPLAKNLIRKRLEMARRARGIARAQDETRTKSESLARKISEHKEQLAAVLQKLKLYEETRPSQHWASSICAPLQGGSVVTDDEVEVAFLEEKQRRSGAAPSTPEASGQQERV